MRFKTNLVISAVFVALLAFVYVYEIKGGEEREAAATRAKQLLDFSDHEATRIFVQRRDTSIVLGKMQDGWSLQTPVESAADKSAIERYLRNLRETEVERVIEDSAAVADDSEVGSKYGLDNPRLQVHLELAEGMLDTIAFGTDSPTERYSYARRSGSNPEIFTVLAWRFDNLDKGVFNLRDRRVLAFEEAEVREIRLVNSAEMARGRGTSESELRLVRGDGEGWVMMPIERTADESEVDALLRQLKDAKAESYSVETPSTTDIEEYGLAPPALEIALLLGEERAEKRLTLGSPASDGQRHAMDASRSPIFLVDSTLVNRLSRPAFELRKRQPLAVEDRDAIAGIEYYRDGVLLFTAGRDTSGGWTLVTPERRKAKAWKLNSLLTDIDGLEAEEFVIDAVSESDIALVNYGLDEPELQIVLRDVDGVVAELRLGEKGGETFMIRDEVASVYRLPSEALEDLSLEFDEVSQTPPKDTDDNVGKAASADANAASAAQ